MWRILGLVAVVAATMALWVVNCSGPQPEVSGVQLVEPNSEGAPYRVQATVQNQGPGHGEVTILDGLKGLRQYVSDVIEAARRAKAAGRTREQFLAEVDLPQYKDYQGWGDRFKANAAAAWDELAR